MLVGLDVLRRGRNTQVRRRLQDKKVALLTHAAAVDEQGHSAIEVLRSLSADLKVIFSPEHGQDGVAQAEEAIDVDDANVGETRLVSLYGSTKASLTPRPEDLEGVDLLIVDLVDVGSRYYTYVWTALLAAQAAAEAGIHTIILDRPNPLTGNPHFLEGQPQKPHLCSFVGLKPLPIRHCMTLGEVIVSVFNEQERSLGTDGALSVISPEGWERLRYADAWGRPFVPPSPNMPTPQTAQVYPGACLLEGTNLSEGRGTTTPFQLVGAPFLEPGALAQAIGEVPGAWVRPCRFRPSFEKHAGRICNGVMLHVKNPFQFRPVETYLRLIHSALTLSGEEFQFLDRAYEFETDKKAFDLLTGNEQIRSMLSEGAPISEISELLCKVDEEWIARVETAEELVSEVQA